MYSLNHCLYGLPGILAVPVRSEQQGLAAEILPSFNQIHSKTLISNSQCCGHACHPPADHQSRRSNRDGLAAGIAVIGLGSLVFFLLQITYNGAYQGRVQWMLFWFVFASVLTARIGIEQGRGYAAGYSGVMGLVCALFAFRFLDEYIVGTLVLLIAGTVWLMDIISAKIRERIV